MERVRALKVPRSRRAPRRWAAGLSVAACLLTAFWLGTRVGSKAEPQVRVSAMSEADRADDELLRDVRASCRPTMKRAGGRWRPCRRRREEIREETSRFLRVVSDRGARGGRTRRRSARREMVEEPASGPPAAPDRPQIDHIETVFLRVRPQLIDLRADLEKKRLVQNSVMERPDVKTDEAARAIDETEKARSRLEKARALMFLEIRQVLTPEQRDAMMERREELRERRVDRLRRPRAGAPAPPE